MDRDDFELDMFETDYRRGNPRDNYKKASVNSREYMRLQEQKRRKRKKARMRRALLTVLLTVVLVGALAGVAFLIVHLINGKKSDDTQKADASKGQIYVHEIDLTKEIAANIAIWLSDVEEIEVDATWVKQRVGDFAVKAKLTMTKSGFNKGSYTEEIDEASYNEMCASVDSCINDLLCEIIAERLVMAGYAESVSKDEALAIAEQVLSMDPASYIKENNIRLYPELESLKSEYNMSSGEYSIAKGKITWVRADNSTFEESIVMKKNSLALPESGRVYLREDR